MSGNMVLPQGPGGERLRGPTARSKGYENRLIAILALAGGIAALDAQAIFYLSAFIMPELHLTNGQMGLIGSAVLVGWAVSGFVVARFSDRFGMRVPFLVGAFLCFALLSGVSGLANSFVGLMIARFAIGLAEGPVIPVKQAVVMAESSPHRRGLNMGIVQNLGAQFIGTLLAPLMLVAIAEHLGWRWGFLIAGLPGLIIALVIWKFVAEPSVAEPHIIRTSKPWTHALNRNTALCLAIGICSVAWYFLILTFMPLFLTGSRSFDPGTMAAIMGVMGAAGAIAAVMVPGLSDRFGRKPAVAVFSLVGMIAPLGAIGLPGNAVLIGLAMLVGCLMSGTFPLFMATVPQESVPGDMRATATATVIATAQVVGGLVGPSAGGQLADKYGLHAPLLLAAALAALAAFLALFLRETNFGDQSE